MRLRAKKIVLMPEMAQLPESDKDSKEVPKNELSERLDGLLPSNWLVSVQCAQSAFARSVAEWLGDVFDTQFMPNSWLNAGAPRSSDYIDWQLEKLRSSADAVVVVADAEVLRELALYYLGEVRGETYAGKLPDFGADEVFVLDLWAGVFQTILPLSPAR